MKTQALGIMALVAALVAGCQQQETPNDTQARLVAAQNIELQEQLAARQAQLAALEQKHEEELRARDEELAQCRTRIKALQKDLEEGIAERVRSVTTAVVDENARLRQEVEALRAEITRLKTEVEQQTAERERLKAETERLQPPVEAEPQENP